MVVTGTVHDLEEVDVAYHVGGVHKDLNEIAGTLKYLQFFSELVSYRAPLSRLLNSSVLPHNSL